MRPRSRPHVASGRVELIVDHDHPELTGARKLALAVRAPFMLPGRSRAAACSTGMDAPPVAE
jgi:hypothetical protein